MTVYKLRHKPTGLYFVPARGRYSARTNIAAMGKVYSRKPSLSLIGFMKDDLSTPIHVAGRKDLMISWRDDWEIVKFKMEEVE